MKFDYAATTPLVTETLGSDFVGMESSGAEFLPALHKKKIKNHPGVRVTQNTRARFGGDFSGLESRVEKSQQLNFQAMMTVSMNLGGLMWRIF